MKNKQEFYAPSKMSRKTLCKVPASVVIDLPEDKIWVWLYKREVAVKAYEHKFAEDVTSEKLVMATEEDLKSAGVAYTEQDLKLARFWRDTTAVEGQQSIVTRFFNFPTLNTETDEKSLSALQKLTGMQQPYIIKILGAKQIHIGVYLTGTAPSYE